MSFICIGRRAIADPWSTQPLIGIIGQYASNPALLPQSASNPAGLAPAKSETNGAFVLNLPVNYDLDSFHFSATPNVRYGNASGYSSITSNYFRLDTSAQFVYDLGSTTLSAARYRDSSLFYTGGGINNGVGVRRDTTLADVIWQRALTERTQLQLDVNTVKTTYAQSNAQASENNLIDYRYTAVSPALTYALSERNTFRFIPSVSRYSAIDGITESNSTSFQLGFDRQLNELWTLKTTAGYSKVTDRQKFYFSGFYLGTIDSTQKSTVYSANLVRQTEALTLNFGASQGLVPTGFSYLSRQQSANFQANYTYSERWSFTANLSRQHNSNPAANGGSNQYNYNYATISANWHWTEQWVLTLQATRIDERYDVPAVTGTSSGVSLQISRQFLRMDL